MRTRETQRSGEHADRGSTPIGGARPIEAERAGPAVEHELDPALVARLARNADGLVCAVVQQHDTREVLMVAWMDDAALARMLETREGTYWSRSRGAQWIKGATSGHTQRVREVRLDCDGDTVLVLVDQAGAACHTGDHTCFYADVLLPADL